MPLPRGPISELVIDDLLTRRAVRASTTELARACATASGADVLADEDVQLTLTVLYELHYRGLDGVDDDWEWEPTSLDLRRLLERALHAALCAQVGMPVLTSEPIDVQLRRLVRDAGGPSLARHLQHRGTVTQYREFVAHRSIYHLKEADPHSWVIPRLSGRAKAALVEIQSDEYGGGRPERMHSALFAQMMRALGLDDGYGHYVDAAPATTLCAVNIASYFGLHRGLRGAIIGHLAVLEMDSAVPNRRYGDGLRRLGFGQEATWFYDEHVHADAVHDQVAAVDMCGSLVRDEPQLAADVLFGAATCLAMDSRFATMLLDSWGKAQSSLRIV